MAQWDAVVIGAGHNGLIAACYLARAGKKVLALERWETVGGACVTDTKAGYLISTGAYLCSLLRPEIIRDLELMRYGLDIYRRETAGFAPFPDGRSLLLYPDAERTRKSLTEFCRETPEDVEAYFTFEADVERACEIVEPWLMRDPPTEAELEADFARQGAERLYREFVVGSVGELLDARFRSPQLKAVLATDGLIGTYGGPYTRGTAYVLLHHYLGNVLGIRGAWGYVRGGMGQITQALAQSLRNAGGVLRTGATVDQIQIRNDRAVAVVLEGGEEIRANAILSNADPYETFARLLGQSDESAAWNKLKTQGGASAKINLAVSELPRFTCLPERRVNEVGPEHLGTIHLCPDVASLERAWDSARQGIPSPEPMIEMYLQTATDASLAPDDRHILSLFTQYFPYNLAPGLDLKTERERYADRVIEIIGRYAPNVPGSIIHRDVLTPRDLEARFGLTGGHIFHGDLLPPQLWSDRPAKGFRGSRTPVRGLYLCGSGAHPGGCVFGAPGYNAAHAVLADEA